MYSADFQLNKNCVMSGESEREAKMKVGIKCVWYTIWGWGYGYAYGK